MCLSTACPLSTLMRMRNNGYGIYLVCTIVCVCACQYVTILSATTCNKLAKEQHQWVHATLA